MRAISGIALVVSGSGRLLAAEAAIPQKAVHIIETGEAPETIVFPEEGAGLTVQPGIGLVWVLNEFGRVGVETDTPGRSVESEIGRRLNHGDLITLGPKSAPVHVLDGMTSWPGPWQA